MGLLDSARGNEAVLSENFDYSDYEIEPLTPEEGQALSAAIDMAAQQYADEQFKQIWSQLLEELKNYKMPGEVVTAIYEGACNNNMSMPEYISTCVETCENESSY